MMLADVQFTVENNVVAARLSGEVDSSNATQLGDAIAEATHNHALAVVLDLSAVDYLDSAGIHLIYRLRENLRARGQKLMLVIPGESPVRYSLRLAGVTSHLPIAATPAEALAALGAAAPEQSLPEDSDRDSPQGEPAI